MFYQTNLKFYNNEVRNVTSTNNLGSAVYGLYFRALNGTASIYNNKVHDISYAPTTTYSYYVYGMYIEMSQTGTNNAYIYNNMIYNITHGYSGTETNIIVSNGVYLGSSNSANTYNFDFNSVRISGPINASSTCIRIPGGNVGVYKIRYNVFANLTGAQTTARHINIYTATAGSIGSTGSVSNCNVLYILNTSRGYVCAALSNNYSTLSDWTAAISNFTDNQSRIYDPMFVEGSDLHIRNSVYTPVESFPTYDCNDITWITTDIDGEIRVFGESYTIPFITGWGPDAGADAGEFNGFKPLISPSFFSATVNNYDQINLSVNPSIYYGNIMVAWSTDNVFGEFTYLDTEPLPGDLLPGGGTVFYIGPAGELPNHTGLNSETTYYYRVWTCIWVEVTLLSTDYLAAEASTPVLSYPYSEGFESGHTDQIALAGCYSQSIVNGTCNWVANNLQTSFNRTPHSGDWNATLGNNNSTWLFKSFYLTGGRNYTFDMFARQDMADTSSAYIRVAYGVSDTEASMSNMVVPGTPLTNGAYQLITGQFTPVTTGIYYIGIYGYLDSFTNGISIDDIMITDSDLVPSIPLNGRLSANGNNMTFAWDNVTQTQTLQSVNVNYYIIYASNNPNATYEYLGYTTNGNTEFIDINGAIQVCRFYKVIAFKGNIDALQTFIINHPSIP